MVRVIEFKSRVVDGRLKRPEIKSSHCNWVHAANEIYRMQMLRRLRERGLLLDYYPLACELPGVSVTSNGFMGTVAINVPEDL